MVIHLTTLQTVLAIISGGLVGFTLGLIGGGGSILAVPLLLYVVGIHNPHVVIGTTALAVAVNAFINLIPHWRAGHVRWKAAVSFAIPGSIGAVLGSVIGKMVNGKDLLFLFAILMLVIAIKMLRTKPVEVNGGERKDIKMKRVLGTGAATGVVSGFFGIGGGFLIVPGLMFSTGMTMIDAIGSSLFSVGTFGLTTAMSYSISGLVDWWIFFLYVIGGIAGGIGGTMLSSRLGKNKRALQLIFSIVIIVVAIYMLYDNMSTFQW